jgi:hypothetical protein
LKGEAAAEAEEVAGGLMRLIFLQESNRTSKDVAHFKSVAGFSTSSA